MLLNPDEEPHLTPGRLAVYVRFKDLVAANIVRNWPTLLRLIDVEGFPPGKLLGRNTRAWRLEDVETWLASRPIDRKVVKINKQFPKRSAVENSAAGGAHD